MKTHHEQLQSNHENSLLGVSPEAFREGAAGGGWQLALGTREKNENHKMATKDNKLEKFPSVFR